MKTLGNIIGVIALFAVFSMFFTTKEERAEYAAAGREAGEAFTERTEANRQAITSREMEIDDGLKAVLQSAITSAGFNCPAAKLAFSRGETPQGPSMMVWCGPADQEGVFEQARYLVTVLPDDRINVRPYEG